MYRNGPYKGLLLPSDAIRQGRVLYIPYITWFKTELIPTSGYTKEELESLYIEATVSKTNLGGRKPYEVAPTLSVFDPFPADARYFRDAKVVWGEDYEEGEHRITLTWDIMKEHGDYEDMEEENAPEEGGDRAGKKRKAVRTRGTPSNKVGRRAESLAVSSRRRSDTADDEEEKEEEMESSDDEPDEDDVHDGVESTILRHATIGGEEVEDADRLIEELQEQLMGQYKKWFGMGSIPGGSVEIWREVWKGGEEVNGGARPLNRDPFVPVPGSRQDLIDRFQDAPPAKIVRELLMQNNFLDYIVSNTNKRMNKGGGGRKEARPLSVGELLQWVGIKVGMSLQSLPRERYYFINSEPIGAISFPSTPQRFGMPHKRFEAINRYLAFEAGVPWKESWGCCPGQQLKIDGAHIGSSGTVEGRWVR